MGLVRERLLPPPAFCPVQSLSGVALWLPGLDHVSAPTGSGLSSGYNLGLDFPSFLRSSLPRDTAMKGVSRGFASLLSQTGTLFMPPFLAGAYCPGSTVSRGPPATFALSGAGARGHRGLQPEPILSPGIPVLLGTTGHAPGFLCACLFHFSLLSFIWHFMSLDPGGAGAQTGAVQGYGTK